VIRRMDRPDDPRGGMDWLGPEFVTWLWWRSSTDPRFRHQDGTEVYVHVDEYLELRGERAAARKTTLRTGMPGASAEGKVALRGGKVVTAARLILARGEEEVTFTLRAEDLDVSAAKLPTPDAAADSAEERLAAALTATRRLYADLDLCLGAFLDVRCGDAWEAEVARVRAWAAAPSEEERSMAGSARD
jgi:hypothetical protein